VSVSVLVSGSELVLALDEASGSVAALDEAAGASER
jgi:hypothetical protein